MNEVMTFYNENLGTQVRTILNEDGSISMNAEDAAIGFGWVQEKDGTKYVRWERMNDFLEDFGFSPQVGKTDYIPESMFYLLGMKASNETAKEFQKWLAVDVIPAIRKTGQYAVRPKQDYSYPFVNDVQVKFYKDMPVLTLDDLCILFGCEKSTVTNKMYQSCWPGVHRYVLRGYELNEFKQRYGQYHGIAQLTVVNQEGINRINFTGRPVELLQLQPCEEALPNQRPVNITINIQNQLPPDKREILQAISKQIETMLNEG